MVGRPKGDWRLMTIGSGRDAPTLDFQTFFTENSVVVGTRDTGKSHFVCVLAEEFVACVRRLPPDVQPPQLVIFAPSGHLYGLRAGRLGRGRGGCGVIIVGGSHGDFPLTPEMGVRLAELSVGMAPCPVLVEMDGLSATEQGVLLTDFATGLYDLQGEHGLLHVIIDEAEHLFSARAHRGTEQRSLDALDAIVRRCRTRGIGVTMVTSRLSSLHGNMTSQADTFFFFRATVPHDIAVIAELAAPGKEESKREEIGQTIGTLKRGEALMVRYGEPFGRARLRVRRRKTFDSNATPSVREKKPEPSELKRLSRKTLRTAERVLRPKASESLGSCEPGQPGAHSQRPRDR